MSARVLLISLEGAPTSLFSREEVKAAMPHFSRKRDKLSEVALDGGDSHSALANWGTFLTGQTPDIHGISDDLRVVSERPLETALPTAVDLKSPSFLETAAQAGHRVAGLNLPLTSAGPSLPDAVILPGGLAKRAFARASSPPDLLPRIQGLLGSNPDRLPVAPDREGDALVAFESGDPGPWTELQINRDAEWIRAAEWLLQSSEFDLVALNLEGVGSLLRVGGECLEGDASPELLAALHLLDDSLARLDRAAGPDAVVIYASPFQLVEVRRVLHINECLSQLGLLAWQESAPMETEGNLGDLPLQGAWPVRRPSLPPVDFEGAIALQIRSGAEVRIHFTDRTGSEESAALVDRLRALSEVAAALRFDDPTEIAVSAEPGSPDLILRLLPGIGVSSGRSETMIRELSHAVGMPGAPGWLWSAADLGLNASQPVGSVCPLVQRLLGTSTSNNPDPLLNGSVPPALQEPGRGAGQPGASGLDARGESDARNEPTAEERIHSRLKALGYVE